MRKAVPDRETASVKYLKLEHAWVFEEQGVLDNLISEKYFSVHISLSKIRKDHRVFVFQECKKVCFFGK